MTKEIVQVDEVFRDTLQSVAGTIPTDVKQAFIERVYAARRENTSNLVIEATSFVSPKHIPQHADAAELIKALEPTEGVTISVLIPNVTGFNNAMEADGGRGVIGEIAVFTAASETFLKHNMNKTPQEVLEQINQLIQAARDNGKATVAYVSCAVLCPYEEYVKPDKVRDVAAQLLDLGCNTIKLGATTGEEDTGNIAAMLDQVLKLDNPNRFGAHFHDTDGFGMANNVKALEYGVRRFDGSAGGIGVTRYAGKGIGVIQYEGKGLPSNTASDELAAFFKRMGYTVNADPATLVDAAQYLHTETGLPIYSKFAMHHLALQTITQR